MVSDCRFMNEITAIKHLGGTTIRMVRISGYSPEDEHPSETSLDDYQADAQFAAPTGIENIHALVDDFMRERSIFENLWIELKQEAIAFFTACRKWVI